MKSDQVYMIMDYETFSEADITSVGAYEYSVHPSTEIMCVAWRIGTRENIRAQKTKFWSPQLKSEEGFGEFLRALRNPSVLLVAHNALFEQVITKNVFATKYMPSKHAEFQSMPVSRWICSASIAAVLALPRKLEQVGAALKLPIQKDKEGHRLMLKLSQPRTPTKHNPKTRHDDPEDLKRLIQYCVTDVDAEVEVFLRCPPLSKMERKIWELDQEINQRGFLVDRPLVNTILKMIDDETKILNRETSELTFGVLDSATQRDRVLNWVEEQGVKLENLRKKTVEDTLKNEDLPVEVKRMLEMRQAVSKTSTAKYHAFEMRSRFDGRLRDILLYAAASTRRWGGMGVQPQNFPRGSIKDSVQACDILRSGDLELARLIYGEPMNVFSSCLRGMIIASPGKILDVADYAAIEARVLFWIARHEDGVEAFLGGRDLYIEQASEIFGIPMHLIGKDSLERFVGKGVILGCGYAMGGKKFAESCDLQGRPISRELADAAVKAYRRKHHPVVKLWSNINMAAVAAVQNPGKKFTINRVTWFVSGEFLYCELPSGGRLAYYGPKVMYTPTPWGEKRATLFHWGINSVTRKWEFTKTYGGKLVENVVQGTARDLMAEAMLRIEEQGPWKIVLSVHDELVAERDRASSVSNEDFCKLMATLPAWAEGCPVAVEGWEGHRYKK